MFAFVSLEGTFKWFSYCISGCLLPVSECISPPAEGFDASSLGSLSPASLCVVSHHMLGCLVDSCHLESASKAYHGVTVPMPDTLLSCWHWSICAIISHYLCTTKFIRVSICMHVCVCADGHMHRYRDSYRLAVNIDAHSTLMPRRQNGGL